MTENDTAGSKGIPLRSRNVGTMHIESGGELITVDHVYAPEGSFDCDECGDPGHDPGMVGLYMNGDDRQEASALMTAEEALMLANRLQRAASLVLESGEDRPDVEREAARYAVPDDASEAEDPEEAAARRTKQLYKDVCDAWNELPEGHPSPVKRVARDLGVSPADVQEIIFPPEVAEDFGTWDYTKEPDLPEESAGS